MLSLTGEECKFVLLGEGPPNPEAFLSSFRTNLEPNIAMFGSKTGIKEGKEFNGGNSNGTLY